MLKHFFVTTSRFFLKQKTYSGINLLGLSVGLASVILISLWINDELSFDKFHEKGANIYQIYENQTYDGGQLYTFASTPGPLAENIIKDYPEIKEASRVTWGERLLFQIGEKNIYESGIYADKEIFAIFSFPVLEGDPKNPLPDNSSIAISDELAKKYYGNVSPIGKSFVIDSKVDVKVTAVFKTVPENSTLQFDFVLPFHKYLTENKWLEDWGNNGVQTFVLLSPGADPGLLATKIKGYVKKHHEGSVVDLLINPLAKWRLYQYQKGVQADGRITFVKLFAAVAIFILFIACINFMNMATARATLRMKEVGIRKVSGAQRISIIGQFIGESIVTTFLALLLSLGLAYALLPFFNDLTQKHLTLPFDSALFDILLLLITIFTGVIAGSYPAFFLSSFQPAQVLKGKLMSGGGNFSLRKGLVVFQFFLSIILIISALVIGRQIDYIRTKDLGFDRDNIVSFVTPASVKKNFDAFRNELSSIPGVISIGRSNAQPYSIGSSTGGIDWDGKPKDVTILIQISHSDHNFFPTTGMKLVAGRNFSVENPADTSNFIITEEAARVMNFKEPIGQRLRWDGKEGQVIGVLKDFHAWNLHFGMQPVVYGYNPNNARNAFIKIAGQNTEQTVKAIEKTYKKFESDFPFEFHFLDEQVNQMYRSELTVGRLATVFTFMAILISCMGLFALASFTAERRTKEIGIRKVLGASVMQLTVSLCSNFLMLVIIAIVLGVPISWYLMQMFLHQYQFHTEIDLTIFLVAGLLLLVIALVTVAYQSSKAALVNPASSLRSE